MKILLVDDHVLFREGVASLLDTQADMTILGQAASANEAVVRARELKPDIILMDVSMPGGSGFDAAKEILSEQPDINIIFLTVHEDDEYLFDAIASGGKGYLLKNMRTSELLDKLRGITQGKSPISVKMTSRILVEFARMRRRLAAIEPIAEEVSLTIREREILNLVAEGASNTEIASRLVVATSTVKNHISNILSKLHLKTRWEAATFARRRGLIKPPKN